MISLKKYLDQKLEAQKPAALRETSVLEVAIHSYRAALIDMGNSGYRACPAFGAGLQQSLSGLEKKLGADCSSAVLQQTSREVNEQLSQWGERTAAAFMGIRLECAQCHKHPFDRWSQAEYRAYANIFGQVIAVGISDESKKTLGPKLAPNPKKPNPNQPQLREVYLNPRLLKVQKLSHPDTSKPLTPKALGGPEIPLTLQQD